MAGILRSGTFMATAALTLPLWLGSCTPAPPPSIGSGIPAGATAVEPAAPAAQVPVPVPQPQAPPPPLSATVDAAAPPLEQSATPTRSAESPETGTVTTPAPGVVSAPSATPSAVPQPSPTPETSAPPQAPSSAGSSAVPPGQESGTRQVTAYYVLLDDGGAAGVRFGCNDSLASVRRTAEGPAEPLPAAMNALLDGSTKPAPGLYNALATSTLTFLSGTFDGTTVTVYLSGALRPGGVCDVPRIEAQLTQTAVASVGAVRADIYVNGVGLTEALSLK
ncbi:GerMN domain-containing protein [Pseudarthrobacter sulfonivorans]|uniref:GerMN domain-containing protein n=1 Tax=Pseudarthrobacter sulfonivorans TaxID=121292 RepID=UPI002782F2AE|nr:GerMN domain-containing protein [Pseudarthrobacter sulfonivorans]MDP9998721.1 hypothetical protein [Pseudarthrobacter sulfonivorans]